MIRCPSRRVFRFVLLVLLAGGSAARADPPAATGALRLALEDGRLSVAAHDVAVGELLAAITDLCALTVIGHAPPEKRISIALRKVPVQVVVRRLLRDRGFLLRQSSPLCDETRPGRLRIFPGAVASGHAGGGAIAPGRISRSTSLRARIERSSALAIDGGDRQAALAEAAAGLDDESSAVRREAIYALGEIGGTAALDLLRRALAHPEAEVREAAIEACLDIGDDAAAEAIATVLHDRDASVRGQAIEALGEIGSPTAIRLLGASLAY